MFLARKWFVYPAVGHNVIDRVRFSGIQELKYDELKVQVAEHPVLYLFLHSPGDKAIFVSLLEISGR